MSALECAVCEERFEEPQLLVCGHTLCSHCVDQLSVADSLNSEALYERLSPSLVVRCPQCGLESNKDQVTVDYVTAAALEGEAWRERAKEESGLCGVCKEEGPTEKYCTGCHSFLCPQCTAAHKRMSTFTQHKLCPPDLSTLTFNPKPRVVFCSNHPNVAVNMYCFNCNELICNECMCVVVRDRVQGPSPHASHEVHTITDESLTHLTEKVQHLVVRAKQLQGSLDQDLCVLKSQEEAVKVHPEKLKKAVNETVDSWIATVELARAEALQDIAEDYKTTLSQYQEEKAVVAGRISGLEAGLRYTGRAMQCTGQSTKYSMLAQAQKLLVAPVRDVFSSETPTSCMFYQVKTPQRESTCLSLLVSCEQSLSVGRISRVELGRESSIQVCFKHRLSDSPLFRLAYLGKTKRYVPLSRCTRKESCMWEVVFHPRCIGRYQVEAQVFGKWIAASQTFCTSPLSQLNVGDRVCVSTDAPSELLLSRPVNCEVGKIKNIQYSSSGSGRTINYCFDISWDTIDTQFKFSYLRNSYNPFPLELVL